MKCNLHLSNGKVLPVWWRETVEELITELETKMDDGKGHIYIRIDKYHIRVRDIIMIEQGGA